MPCGDRNNRKRTQNCDDDSNDPAPWDKHLGLESEQVVFPFYQYAHGPFIAGECKFPMELLCAVDFSNDVELGLPESSVKTVVRI